MKDHLLKFLRDESGWLSAVITGGAALLGGAMDRRQRRKDAYANSGLGIRADAERSGFNPLTLLNSGARAVASYAPTMGSAIANAGATAANQITESRALEIENQRLENETKELNARLEAQTLRPQVAGVYGRTEGSGSQDANQKATDKKSETVQGMPQGSANPALNFGQSVEADTVFEIESDAYKEAVEGNANLPGGGDRGIVPWGTELIRRNVRPETFTFLQAYARGLNPNSYVDAAKDARQTFRGRYDPAKDDEVQRLRHDVWRAQNYGPKYNPESWR